MRRAINLCTLRSEYYYVQTNNDVEKMNACYATTITAGMDIIDEDISVLANLHSYKQPEDNLSWYLRNNPGILEYCRRSHPGSSTPAYMWGDCMVKAVNDIYGKSRIYFKQPLSWENIMTELCEKKLPVAISCRYPGIDGHFVLVVGCDTDYETGAESLIINDPYKNTLKNIPDGFNNYYSREDFNRVFKGYGTLFMRA